MVNRYLQTGIKLTCTMYISQQNTLRTQVALVLAESLGMLRNGIVRIVVIKLQPSS